MSIKREKRKNLNKKSLKAFIIFTFLCLKISCKCYCLKLTTIPSNLYNSQLLVSNILQTVAEKSNKGPQLLWMRSNSSFPQGQQSPTCKLMTKRWTRCQVRQSPALHLTARAPRLNAQTRMAAQGVLTLKAKVSDRKPGQSFNLSAKPSKRHWWQIYWLNTVFASLAALPQNKVETKTANRLF